MNRLDELLAQAQRHASAPASKRVATNRAIHDLLDARSPPRPGESAGERSRRRFQALHDYCLPRGRR